jgi:putative membrane protein
MEAKIGSVWHYLRILVIGGAMGVANIIPGVSGGTIAVVFGIYEDLMEALGNFLTDKIKRWVYVLFLVVLFSGALVAIVSLAPFLSWAFANHPLPTVYFFIGLIIGSIPIVIRSHDDMKIDMKRSIAFLIGLIVVIILALMQTDGASQGTAIDFASFSIMDYLYFLFCGMIAASAMIVPGVSGSFILILLGVYWTVLASISGLTTILFQEGLTGEMITRLFILGSLGIGIVIGILGISRIMSWALKNYPAPTMYAILGLIFGSLYQIYPGFEFNWNGLIAVITLILGVVISLIFEVWGRVDSSQ